LQAKVENRSLPEKVNPEFVPHGLPVIICDGAKVVSTVSLGEAADPTKQSTDVGLGGELSEPENINVKP
jgi:hypothetical protein